MFKKALLGAVCALSMSGLFAQASWAQEATALERANDALAKGDAPGAEAAFTAVLEASPGDQKALIGRATARSWAGKHQLAREDYNAVLQQDANNLEALTGLGYDYAWAGDYAEAMSTFQKAQAIAPDNAGVAKGIAYTQLWSGKSGEAANSFDTISKHAGGDAEALEGKGTAHLNMGHAGRAEAAYNQSLAIDPNRTGAKSGLEAAYALPPVFEASVWVGNSAEGGDTGVRSAELGSWVTPDTRLGMRYDNSLSLDNPTLARLGQDAETWFLSAQHNFNGKFIGVAEVGKRDLPAGADQDIFKLEGVVLGDGRAYKLGGQFSPHSDGYDDTLVYGGVNFGLSKRVRMDATLFMSESGAAGDKEVRGAVFTEYTSPDRWTVGVGAGFGNISSDIPTADGSVTTAHVLASMPVAKRHSAYIQARWEDSPINEYSTVMVGVTFRLPRW
jgi:tetratricopeptide (TPR) repeat protein